MPADTTLTSSELLTAIVTLLTSGSFVGLLIAMLGWRAGKPEKPVDPAPPPTLPPEARAAIACGLAERIAVERLDQIDHAVGDLRAAVERLFQTIGRGHGEIGDQIRRLADRIERAIDEGRETRRAVEDLRER
ncbi:MAG: hypothetical protein HZA68_20500 [Rhodovulum sp.]|nr:hypothetical protein [Rhodovulum sp.]